MLICGEWLTQPDVSQDYASAGKSPERVPDNRTEILIAGLEGTDLNLRLCSTQSI